MRSAAELALALVALAPGLAHAETCHHGVVQDDTIVWETRSTAATLLSPISVDSIEGGTIEDAAIVPRASSTMVRVRTRQPIGQALQPPLVRGPQRITLASPSGEPVAFEPRLDGPIERHVGYSASAGIERADRRRIDLACGRAAGIPLYVHAEAPLELAGTLSRPEKRQRALLWIGGVLLVAAGIGGVLSYRRVRDRAAAERAEALLEERYRALDREGP